MLEMECEESSRHLFCNRSVQHFIKRGEKTGNGEQYSLKQDNTVELELRPVNHDPAH